MGYKYSLAKVQVVLSQDGAEGFPKYFGGNGSMIGSITVARNTERFSAEGDATGGYVINENLDPTGTITISIKQFAPLVSTLTNIFNDYNVYQGSNENAINFGTAQGLNITIYYQNTKLAVAKDCYLNMPELPLEEENGSRDFTLVCGEVHFEMLDPSTLAQATA